MEFYALEGVIVFVMKLATHQKAVLVNRNISYPNMINARLVKKIKRITGAV
eukprot:GAHX01005534.1.p2 GENE.GAHX01005534.1~~GAHX01005534.1.p2  ORF type:complete len:51 (+),score=6.36 GAHX01005534.1:110-262(+)